MVSSIFTAPTCHPTQKSSPGYWITDLRDKELLTVPNAKQYQTSWIMINNEALFKGHKKRHIFPYLQPFTFKYGQLHLTPSTSAKTPSSVALFGSPLALKMSCTPGTAPRGQGFWKGDDSAADWISEHVINKKKNGKVFHWLMSFHVQHCNILQHCNL